MPLSIFYYPLFVFLFPCQKRKQKTKYTSYDTVNVILVVGHEKLNVEMQRTYGAQMAVVKIPKSGGVSRLFSRKILILPITLRCV